MKALLFYLSLLPLLLGCGSDSLQIMTVNGPVPANEMGLSLIHEHVFLDWSGADSINASQWNTEEAYSVILPYLEAVEKQRVRTFLECTPAYLGRNPHLLKRLSDATGLQILTNTGYYGARENKFLPAHAFEESADQLAARWIEEVKNGIEGTGIRPGFIKIGVDRDSTLSPIQEKLIRAAGKTHLRTGLTIVGHTGPDAPAFAQLKALADEGVAPEAFVWTHAQNGTSEGHIAFAKRGGWVSLDGMGWMAPDTASNPNARTPRYYSEVLKALKERHLLHRVLISHDAGWYTHGDSLGGPFRPYTDIFNRLIPALRSAGFTQEDIDQLFIKNPPEAYAIRVRGIH